ncbi:hypothetical protein ADK82_32180 [Streptomyces sp. NRRL S-4]|nr:hypothetical protein ADK82_32180 [Streptomyces sp. NRRL S-4]
MAAVKLARDRSPPPRVRRPQGADGASGRRVRRADVRTTESAEAAGIRMRRVLATLEDRERDIIELRFGQEMT